jgi:hypothetical protein
MRKVRDILAQQFWIFSIVAVIFLAPSSGLITLTVPDEPYGNVLVGLPDIPHIAKRTSDDAEHLALDAAVIVYRINLALIVTGDAVPGYRSGALSIVALRSQIRGPPAGVA